ncbi:MULTISPECIES: ABC transporter permease [Paenibacillus]|jgi:peptide/nickel transport system permease protein|uniref:Diguanylate cyclase n=1 Tax=Paenibacillus odorifer TaxID=189426 RepID=A0A1R0WV27_9BACL|nr:MULTISPECIES: ABC transporter permease [Paenibacillus]AIQ75384.1 diguanylate cyclase [Paenibacillus odorifer]ETT49919.1 peptide ABC transporter permease [Paenibacillus sp. FSL H8-237]MDH6427797.1 peptide/nickel transport system permease protein [Paenibacillus sp. PastH-4]MDH6444577.1 peptide/nickel transport system permease protein [Paenibacillus sp. PastF-4]MDH6528474.1 peptide/nickel transport system permease protein [Paenibacillus sp. PastH-3]
MSAYLSKRLLYMVIILFAASLLIFCLYASTPGDFITGNIKLTAERKAELREIYGLNKPVLERYGIWMKNALHGDFGYSLAQQKPVLQLFNDYIWNSFLLAAVSTFLTWVIAVIIGVISAYKQYSWFDTLVMIAIFAAMSLPSFFIGLFLIKILAVDLKWLPPGGIITTGSNATGLAYFKEIVMHMTLPVVVMTLLGLGSLTRYFRSNMIDVLKQDYIRTARAKGLKERKVLFTHALRNALLPAITLVGFELPALFGGSLIIEKIFNWPGIGQLYMQSFGLRDYPLLMGFTMFIAILTVIGTLLSDVLYRIADPRVRL